MSQQPIPVIPLEYEKPSDLPGSLVWRRIVRLSHWIALGACVIGTIFIGAVDTEYGVLVGLVIAPAGALLVIGGAINRDGRAAVLGICHVGVCVLFVSLGNLLNWSPRDAHWPMTIMGTIYTAAVMLAARRWGILSPAEARP